MSENLFPWNTKEDPNQIAIFAYIRSVKLKSLRSRERHRLKAIVGELYHKFGVKPIRDYSQEEIIEVFWVVNQKPMRKLQKEKIAFAFKSFLDMQHTSYSPRLFDFRFNEGDHPWVDPTDPNREAILGYLDAPENTNTFNRERRILSFCLRFFYKRFGRKPIQEYDARQFKTLFQEIQKKQVNKGEKKRYRTTLKHFLQDVIEPLRSEGIQITRDYTRIFSSDYYLFKDSQQKRNSRHYLTPKEWNDFLMEIKNVYKFSQDYLLYSLFLTSCRGDGLINLLVKNINFEIGVFDTMDKSKWSRYFFPEHLKPELRAYIKQQNLTPEDRLFTKFAKPARINYRTKTVYKRSWTNHDFRRSILRLWKRAGMGKGDRNTLSNHAKEETDEFYTAEDPWSEPKILSTLYQEYHAYIFSGGPRPRPIGETDFIR